MRDCITSIKTENKNKKQRCSPSKTAYARDGDCIKTTIIVHVIITASNKRLISLLFVIHPLRTPNPAINSMSRIVTKPGRHTGLFYVYSSVIQSLNAPYVKIYSRLPTNNFTFHTAHDKMTNLPLKK